MFKVYDDEKYGYKKIFDIDKGEVKSLYENEYWTSEFFKQKVEKKKGGESLYKEITDLEWMEKTHFLDVLDFVKNHKIEGSKVLDIGCGSGCFLEYMKKHNYDVYGVEPALNLKEILESKGIKVFTGSVFDMEVEEKFDVITLNNVLEHIENPELVVERVNELLNDDGLLVIKVPNDFNLIQEEANRFVHNKNWWVCYPDHLNYFNNKSLSKLVKESKFEILDTMVDYPLDMFLLQGLNYVDNADMGKKAHEMRKQFEVNMEKEKRRELFRGFVSLGIGRNVIIFTRKKRG
ncbi:MAG: class I SAM-dependent methyltransferase [Sarcina sp.]